MISERLCNCGCEMDTGDGCWVCSGCGTEDAFNWLEELGYQVWDELYIRGESRDMKRMFDHCLEVFKEQGWTLPH